MSFIPNNHMVELIVCGIQMAASALSLVGSEVTEDGFVYWCTFAVKICDKSSRWKGLMNVNFMLRGKRRLFSRLCDGWKWRPYPSIPLIVPPLRRLFFGLESMSGRYTCSHNNPKPTKRSKSKCLFFWPHCMSGKRHLTCVVISHRGHRLKDNHCVAPR